MTSSGSPRSRGMCAPICRSLALIPQVIIPISAREGENIAAKSDKMAWHDGPTVLEALDTFTPRRPPRVHAAPPASAGCLQV